MFEVLKNIIEGIKREVSSEVDSLRKTLILEEGQEELKTYLYKSGSDIPSVAPPPSVKVIGVIQKKDT